MGGERNSSYRTLDRSSLPGGQIFSDQNPFSGTRIEALSDVVKAGTRPSKLPGFPDGNKVWEIVQDCWAAEPKSRPESKEVMMRLKRLIKPEIPSGEFSL